MAMELGAYTFAINPNTCTIPQKRKQAAVVETLGGGEFFSWGLVLPGNIIEMFWSFMTTAQFNSLYTLFENDVQIVWDPEDGSTYNVEVLSLFGDYHLSAAPGAAYKKNVRMKIVVMSEV